MIYITVKQSPRYHQMTLDELLDDVCDFTKYVDVEPRITGTRTHVVDSVNEKKLESVDVEYLIAKFREFNKKYADLFEVDRHKLYNTFHIPKNSGGFRKIDAPVGELMEALRQLKFIFEANFPALYHTSAFAYVKGRCTVDSLKRHQQNESKWFAKFDFSNFFGSTTIEFLITQLSIIFPFSEILKREWGKAELVKTLSLCFLDGGLPQGTPISPLLTNILMIPIDHKISNELRNFNKNTYVYTRYADDLLISSKYDFDHTQIYKYVNNVLREFKTPYVIKPEKTRYGSNAGKNWNLGLMINKNNEITVGHRRKKQFKASLHNFIRDYLNGTNWSKEDVQVLSGLISYYKMIELNYVNYLLNEYSKDFKLDVREVIRQKLKSTL